MKFEEKLNELINEVEVPVELQPQNIAAMLKAEKARTSSAEKKNIRHSATVSAQRRNIIMRTAAATAACAVFAAGMLTYNSKQDEQQQIEERIEYEAVLPPPEDYDDLYNIYTDIYLNGNGSTGKTDGYSDDTAIGDETEVTEDPSDIYEYDIDGLDISDSDIVKCDGNYMYCLKEKTLYIVSLETMEVVSKIECTLDPPFDVYIEDGNVIIISAETGEKQVINGADDSTAAISPKAGNSPEGSDVPADDPDTVQPAVNNSGGPGQGLQNDKTGQNIQDPENVSRTDTAVDIYNIQDPTRPVHTASYKQNGSYTASKLVDGKIYTVTAYSGHRIISSDEQAGLDSFVPAYYINGEKFFVDPADIVIPAGISGTEYTVISAMDMNGNGTPSVKAVLGSGKNVYCSSDTLYIVGVNKNDPYQSIINTFGLDGNGIVYRAGTSVNGTLLSRHSMNEYDGNFRIAVKEEDENGVIGVSIYIFDDSLKLLKSSEGLFSGENVTSVRFEGNYARFFESGGKISAAISDLSADPPSLMDPRIAGTAYLYGYSENRLLGVGRSENGGIVLTMYDTGTGEPIKEITFAEEEKETFSKVFDDKRAALAVPEKGIIGIPVYSHTEFGTKNIYYVFSYDEASGFALKGTIEYTDLDDGLLFERGQISGDTLYIISQGRIIAARLDDLKIIGTYEY